MVSKTHFTIEGASNSLERIFFFVVPHLFKTFSLVISTSYIQSQDERSDSSKDSRN
jgi:hypothetical protein